MQSLNSKPITYKPSELAYGGTLRNKRSGRGRRPLATRHTMHLVLRSSKAKQDWSFRRPKNRVAIMYILKKFSEKNDVRIVSFANVGNHLHLQIHLKKIYRYKAFIRAVTSAIALTVAGRNWRKQPQEKFWDLRPFTRIVTGGLKAFLRLRDYIRVNSLEGIGASRAQARYIVERARHCDLVIGFG